MVATPVPAIVPSSSSATNAWTAGLATANSNHCRRSPQPVATMAALAGSMSASVIARITRLGVAGSGVMDAHGRYHRPMPTLSRADVEHVAHLARLGLSDEELGRLEGQLNHILDQYAILATVPTDHIAPTAQTIELENILREDVARPSLAVEDVLANAPARDGDFVVVPAILDERD